MVKRAGLENRYGARPHRGFESPPLRFLPETFNDVALRRRRGIKHRVKHNDDGTCSCGNQVEDFTAVSTTVDSELVLNEKAVSTVDPVECGDERIRMVLTPLANDLGPGWSSGGVWSP